MIAFPGLLAGPAEEAGMKTPPDPDNFNPEEYPHFKVFCHLQLGQPMPDPSAHWGNAKIIAGIPEERIRTIFVDEVMAMGFRVGFS